MFGLLKNCRKLMMPWDIQVELFDRLMVPVLVYGCEVWCSIMTNLASKLQLCFCKIILKLGKSTPSCMVYCELGQFPFGASGKNKDVGFLVQTSEHTLRTQVFKHYVQISLVYVLCGNI